MYRIIIVDDEKPAQLNLQNLLIEYIKIPFTIVGVAGSIEEAETKINLLKPDIVFMDIEMNGESPFDFLNRTRNKPLDIIFVTAYEQYAAAAFQVDAIDYLLKPIDPERLIEAMERVQKSKNIKLLQTSSIEINDILNYLSYSKKNNQIVLKEANQQIIINTNDILFIEAMRSYSVVFYSSSDANHKFTISKPLADLVRQLPEEQFIRMHRSYVVNLHQIAKIIKGERPLVQLKNGFKIPVSRRKLIIILDLINDKKNG